MSEEPGCGWCTDTGRDPAFPDALCPEPDCAAANRERVRSPATDEVEKGGSGP